MLMFPINSNAKERHIRPDENNTRRLGEFQANSYLPSSTTDKSGGQTSNNFTIVQNQARTINGRVFHDAVPLQTSSCQPMLQRLSNDDSLGESNCCVGKHNIKITGDHSELVQMAKLVLDDYFCSNEFLQSGVCNEKMNSTSSTDSTPTMAARNMMPIPQLKSSSPFADNSMGFNIENVSRISNSNESVTTVNPPVANGVTRSYRTHFTRKDLQEDIMVTNARELCDIPEAVPIGHKYEQLRLPQKDSNSDGYTMTGSKDLCSVPIDQNGFTRSRRTHFSRKDLQGEIIVADNREAIAVVDKNEQPQHPQKDTNDPCAMPIAQNDLTRSRRTHFTRKDLEGEMIMTNNKLCALPMVCKYQYDYEQLMQHSKSPLSLMMPKEWLKICEMWASIVRQ